MTSSAAPAHDPTLDVGTLAVNDCRTVCRALKLRAAELRKVADEPKYDDEGLLWDPEEAGR